jgi:hypothetical protein
MKLSDVKPGIFIRTNSKVDEPGSTEGFLIKQHHLLTRKSGELGQVQQYVPGHGGDVWFVMHTDGTVAAYGFPEMDHVDVDRAIKLIGNVTAPNEAENRLRLGRALECLKGV